MDMDAMKRLAMAGGPAADVFSAGFGVDVDNNPFSLAAKAAAAMAQQAVGTDKRSSGSNFKDPFAAYTMQGYGSNAESLQSRNHFSNSYNPFATPTSTGIGTPNGGNSNDLFESLQQRQQQSLAHSMMGRAGFTGSAMSQLQFDQMSSMMGYGSPTHQMQQMYGSPYGSYQQQQSQQQQNSQLGSAFLPRQGTGFPVFATSSSTSTATSDMGTQRDAVVTQATSGHQQRGHHTTSHHGTTSTHHHTASHATTSAVSGGSISAGSGGHQLLGVLPPALMASVVAAAGAAPDCDPRELECFAERFKQRRIKLGVTQADVGAALGKLQIPGVGPLSQSTICRFESLTLSHNNMVALKPILEAWLDRAEKDARERKENANDLSASGKKRKRTSIPSPEKRHLEAFFSLQPRPSGEKIAQIAEKLDLKKNVVRVWFCNQRQKQKRMKFTSPGGPMGSATTPTNQQMASTGPSAQQPSSTMEINGAASISSHLSSSPSNASLATVGSTPPSIQNV